MLNNWTFGSEPVQIYLPFLSWIHWLSRWSQVSGLWAYVSRAEHPICSGVVPVFYTESCLCLNLPSLLCLLDSYLCCVKVQIGLADKGTRPRCSGTSTTEAVCSQWLWRLRDSSHPWWVTGIAMWLLFFNMVHKTKCQTFFFIAVAHHYGKREVDWGKIAFRTPALQLPRQGQ